MWFWLCACASTPEKAEPRASPWADGAVMRAADGRQLLLRGVNARIDGIFDVTFDDGRVALEPIPPFGADDCRFLADELGMDLLRLPVNWSGMEPADDAWDEPYFARVDEVVAACRDAGVYTLLDLHQDAFSKEIGEDGAPLWAIVPPPEELLEGPLDDLAERRTSAQVLAAFRSLYEDAEGLWASYGDAAGELAARFVDDPGVVGVELQNEPVPLGDQAALDGFHAAIADAVRARAPDMPLWFEPDSLRNLTDTMPVGEPFPLPNAVYAPHIYTDVFEDGWADEDEAAIAASVTAAAAEATVHGTPLVVGEFGHDPTTEIGRHYVSASLDAFDEARVGWAFWVYEEWSQGRWGLYGGDTEARGPLREEIADLLARPYPLAVDGTVTSVSWDGATLRIGLDDAGSRAHTVAAPQRTWPGDLVATCDGVAVDVTRVGGRAELPCEGTTIEVSGR